ncbi:glycosyltransferase [uncultured Treponema sp.]|uniref:glycosyltransferase n=2 Tax=uncultured Treponema sp. TaxID=162155 RepID=UPI0025D2407D|nr:glycosyltransferase [uncultured Treponema sp.]
MFTFIIVLYNQKISAEKFSMLNGRIVFCDNSTDAEIKSFNVSFAENLKNDRFFYLDMHGNKGLSKAYNSTIANLSLSENDFVVIFDQDTVIPQNMQFQYENFISENKDADIICPVVLDSVGVMSPSIASGTKFRHIVSISEINEKNLSSYSFINSGMCIKRNVFDRIKYEENLFLDFVDHDFILSAKKNGVKIKLCKKVVLNQNFSGVTKNTYNQDFSRFCIYMKDAKVFYKKWFGKNYKLILLPRVVKLCILHKNPSFLLTLLRNK